MVGGESGWRREKKVKTAFGECERMHKTEEMQEHERLTQRTFEGAWI